LSFNNNTNSGTICNFVTSVSGLYVANLGGSNNVSNCEDVDTNVWFWSNSLIQSYDNITDALADIAAGDPMDDGILHIDSAHTPYVEDVFLDADTTTEYDNIVEFQGGGSDDTLIAGSLFFHGFDGLNISGLTLSEYVEGWQNAGLVALYDVSVAGLDLSGAGAGIEIHDQDGEIYLSHVNANGTTGSGAFLENIASSVASYVNIENSSFEGNSTGLEVEAFGPISLSEVMASYNANAGALISNNIFGSDENIDIIDSGFSYNRDSDGLVAFSNGEVSLQNVTAQNNANGVVLSTLGGVDVGEGTFSHNGCCGLSVENYGDADVSISDVVSLGNSSNGVSIYNDDGDSNVRLIDSLFTFNNIGLDIGAYGVVDLDGVSADLNSEVGAYIYTDGSIQIDSGSFSGTFGGYFDDEDYGNGFGLMAYAAGSIELDGVDAIANFGGGAWLENVGGVGDLSVSNGNFSNNVFSLNEVAALNADSDGMVTLSNLDVSYNFSDGADVTYWDGSFAELLVENSTFNENSDQIVGGWGWGLYADNGAGDATLTNVMTNNNLEEGTWVGTSGSVTVENSTFNENGDYGLDIGADGDISLIDVAANGNLEDGAYLDSDGNIFIDPSVFNNNVSDGVYAYATGEVTVSCNTFANNGDYGLDVDAPVLNLYGNTFANNFGGDYNYTGALNFDANCNPSGGGGGGVSGNQVSFSIVCLNPEVFTTILGRNRALFSLLCGYNSQMAVLDLLPADLPAGYQYLAGMVINVLDNEQLIIDLPAGATVTPSFKVDDLSAYYAILYWNGSEWVELDGVLIGDYFEAQVGFTGIFALVAK
jgi:hypothetical protein